MDLFEPIAGAVGELSACVLGRVVGRTFNLDGRKAQRIGEHVILAVVLGTAVILTVMFS